VKPLISQFHLFSLPTLGENFGHVIAEAFAAGRPVLISDQTAWRGLEAAGAGWDLPLDQPGRFQETLQKCIDMNQEEFDGLCRTVQEYLPNSMDTNAVLNAYRELFGLPPR
jgi:glycosyltransferase involved in cell wall biosynthesis